MLLNIDIVTLFRLLMHSDCVEELDLEDNWIGDLAGREILEALEHRKEGKVYK
jgi:Ran GTPase-activating protein (RanGAP) involved in mRNA processing and transport